MALKKNFVKDDGTVGNYYRLTSVKFPQYNRGKADYRGTLTFSIYRDEAAAKAENRAPAYQLFLLVDQDFFVGMPDIFSLDFEALAHEVYLRKDRLPELADAVDLL